MPSAPTPKCRSQTCRASAGRSTPSTSPGSKIKKSLPAPCIFVKRILLEILAARRHEGHPDEGGRKTVGKRAPVQYLSWVKKEHVYRRRRIGALFVAAVLAFALYAGAGAGAEATSVVYTVSPGDTLWSVATEHYPPSEDPRVAVEAILETNDLPGAQIYPGMRLELPAAG